MMAVGDSATASSNGTAAIGLIPGPRAIVERGEQAAPERLGPVGRSRRWPATNVARPAAVSTATGSTPSAARS